MKRIFLDMDGVLVNWTDRVCRMMGTTFEDVKKSWPPGQGFTLHKGLNSTKDEINTRISLDRDFWFTLDPYPWFEEIWDLCNSSAPTVVLTKPTRNLLDAPAKIWWLRHHLGDKGFKNVLVGSRKEMCAAPGHLLIDDSDQNCKLFSEWGGTSILFPQYWNELHQISQDPMLFTKTAFARWLHDH